LVLVRKPKGNCVCTLDLCTRFLKRLCMSTAELTLEEVTFGELALGEVTFDEVTFDELTFDNVPPVTFFEPHIRDELVGLC
jgi:hypothetical protein